MVPVAPPGPGRTGNPGLDEGVLVVLPDPMPRTGGDTEVVGGVPELEVCEVLATWPGRVGSVMFGEVVVGALPPDPKARIAGELDPADG